jgi:hypothetical protein
MRIKEISDLVTPELDFQPVRFRSFQRLSDDALYGRQFGAIERMLGEDQA